MVREWLVAGMVVMLAAAVRAQTALPPSDYPAAVQAYARVHDAARAVTGLVGWTPSHFASAIEKYPAQPQPQLAVAAVLQIEIGYVMESPALAARHLESGHQLVRGMLASRRSVPAMSVEETTAFAERWYVAAASTLLRMNDSTRAGPFIARGLAVAPRSLDLRLMVGIVEELNAISLDPAGARGGNARMRMAGARMQAFMRAKRRYAELVEESPVFVKARIRLGRVLWKLEEFEASQLELEHASDQARDPVQRYLSWMFLGALYERTGDLAGARTAYEAALTTAPRSQAATVALGHLEVLAGRPDRAQALARELLSEPPVADEWWSYNNGGFEIAALAWLRSRVWQ